MTRAASPLQVDDEKVWKPPDGQRFRGALVLPANGAEPRIALVQDLFFGECGQAVFQIESLLHSGH